MMRMRDSVICPKLSGDRLRFALARFRDFERTRNVNALNCTSSIRNAHFGLHLFAFFLIHVFVYLLIGRDQAGGGCWVGFDADWLREFLAVHDPDRAGGAGLNCWAATEAPD